MNVSDMISIMGTLGIGESQSVSTSQDTALIYLNLAHEELYRETVNFMSKVVQVDNPLSNAANENTIILSKIPYAISSILRLGQIQTLEEKSFVELALMIGQNQIAGPPRFFASQESLITMFPIESDTVYQFQSVYVPERKVLTM